MHLSDNQYILFALMALFGIVLLIKELLTRKVSWLTVWAGLLIFPLYAALMGLNLYPLKHKSYPQDIVTLPEVAQPVPAVAEPQVADKTRPTPSQDGLVSSYGSTKVAADEQLSYNDGHDAMSTICDYNSNTLRISLISINHKLPSQTIGLRLNNEQSYRTIKSPVKSIVGEQSMLTFNSGVVCKSIDMLFVRINEEPAVELLIYRPNSNKND